MQQRNWNYNTVQANVYKARSKKVGFKFLCKFNFSVVTLRMWVPEPVSQRFLSFIHQTQLKGLNKVHVTGLDEFLQVCFPAHT